MFVFANLSIQIDILNSQNVNIRSLHVFYFISLNCLLVTVTGLISDLQILCTPSKDTKKTSIPIVTKEMPLEIFES